MCAWSRAEEYVLGGSASGSAQQRAEHYTVKAGVSLPRQFHAFKQRSSLVEVRAGTAGLDGYRDTARLRRCSDTSRCRNTYALKISAWRRRARILFRKSPTRGAACPSSTEYGENDSAFSSWPAESAKRWMSIFDHARFATRPAGRCPGFTWREKTALYPIGIQTIGQALTLTEADFRKASISARSGLGR